MYYQNNMKKTILVLVLIFLVKSEISAQTETFTLTIKVSGLKSNKGKLLVGLYNTKATFLKKQYKGRIVEIKNKKSEIIFKNIPKGEYAVSFIHDVNNNGKMDTNFLKIPKEDYGCSNNARGFMGPPKFNDAKFDFTSNKTITINLN